MLVYIKPTISFEGEKTKLEVNTYYQKDAELNALLEQYLVSTTFKSSGTKHKQVGIIGCIAVTAKELNYIIHLNELKN